MTTFFNDRLRAERNRLGYSQDELAKLGGVGRNAQVTYEKGERSPDACYLQRLSDAGVDVGFLFTGEITALSIDEGLLLSAWRNTTAPMLRDFIMRGLEAQAKQVMDATVTIHENNGQVIAGKSKSKKIVVEIDNKKKRK